MWFILQKDQMNKLELQQKYDKLQTKQQSLFDKAARHYALYIDAHTESMHLGSELSKLEEELSKLDDYSIGEQMDLFEELK
jgi:predicted nuclease with TOPRIM domain